MKTLPEIIAERPFPDFLPWWPMGKCFLSFMSAAILTEWAALLSSTQTIDIPQKYAVEYIGLVYGRDTSPALAARFQEQDFATPIESGEFDALSYAFYRAAFEALADKFMDDAEQLARERRLFTKRVGRRFFTAVHDHLALDLPVELQTAAQFAQLQDNIATVGKFLQSEGYLRDHFAFTFDVHLTHAGQNIAQDAEQFTGRLQAGEWGYALYEMGYPVILPSAVYLYHTMGEAQHHSSRTIEELFDRIGYEARETDDFDPTGFPSDKVVELWEIRPLG